MGLVLGVARRAGQGAHIHALARALRRVGARVARRALPGVEGAAKQLHQALPVRGHRRHLGSSGGCLQGVSTCTGSFVASNDL